MKTKKLITEVERNRQIHLDTYKRALKQWREKVIKATKKLIKDAKDNKLTEWPQELIELSNNVPKSHSEDYYTAIHMLKQHADVYITIDDQTFCNLVEDNWEWKRSCL